MARIFRVCDCRVQLALIMSVLLVSVLNAKDDVPAILPQPDKNPPSNGKVKVYILAGQSNMVGFGYLQGARPVYPSIYLSADPNIKVGRMPVGPSALLRFGVFQSADNDSQKGANVSIYAGAYQEGTDYSRMKPVKKTTVALGDVATNLPSIDEAHTVVAQCFIEVPMSGTHELHVGYQDSTHAVASLAGNEVYRKEPGQSAVVTSVQLEKGNRYPVTITYMKGGSAALWLKQIDLEGKGDLKSLIAKGKYPWFADEDGNWTVRNDVTYWETRISKAEYGSGGPLFNHLQREIHRTRSSVRLRDGHLS